MYGNDRQSDDCEAAVGVGGHTCCDCSQCRASKGAVSNYSEREYDSNFDGFEHAPEYNETKPSNEPRKRPLTRVPFNKILRRTDKALLIEFDAEYEPLWVPKACIFAVGPDQMAINTPFFEKELKPKRKLKQPLAGQDLVKKYLLTEGNIPHPVKNRQQPPWKDLISDSFKVDGLTKTILPQQNPPCPYCGTTAYCRCGTPL